MPRPSPYDCLVKIAACAVCTGTDHAILNDHFPSRAAYPCMKVAAPLASGFLA